DWLFEELREQRLDFLGVGVGPLARRQHTHRDAIAGFLGDLELEGAADLAHPDGQAHGVLAPPTSKHERWMALAPRGIDERQANAAAAGLFGPRGAVHDLIAD